MSLPIRTVYIDSRSKTKASTSNSILKFDLKQRSSLLDKCVCYSDDVVIPQTWYTIEDVSNKLYVRKYDSGVLLQT